MRRGAPPVQWIRVTRAPARRAAGGAGCAHAAAARGSEKRQRASEREKRPGERRRVHRETGEVRRARGATPRPRINLYCRAQVGQWPMGRSRVPIAAKGAPRARLHIGHIARARPRARGRARGLSAVSCVGDGRVSRLAPLCALSLSRHTLCEPCTHTHTRRPPQNSLQNGPRCAPTYKVVYQVKSLKTVFTDHASRRSLLAAHPRPAAHQESRSRASFITRLSMRGARTFTISAAVACSPSTTSFAVMLRASIKINIHARKRDEQIKVGRVNVATGSQYRKRLLTGKALEWRAGGPEIVESLRCASVVRSTRSRRSRSGGVACTRDNVVCSTQRPACTRNICGEHGVVEGAGEKWSLQRRPQCRRRPAS